jgi:hypothetical protein
MNQGLTSWTFDHGCLSHVLLFWFGDDWGVYGRTYEQIASTLSRLDHVKQVIVVLPSSQGESLATSRQVISHKLTEIRLYWWPTGSALFRLRSLGSRLKVGLEHIQLRRLIRSHGFRSKNTLLWLFPAHPVVDV